MEVEYNASDLADQPQYISTSIGGHGIFYGSNSLRASYTVPACPLASCRPCMHHTMYALGARALLAQGWYGITSGGGSAVNSLDQNDLFFVDYGDKAAKNQQKAKSKRENSR